MELENKEEVRIFPDNEIGKLWKQALDLVADDNPNKQYNLALRTLDAVLIMQMQADDRKATPTAVDLAIDIADVHNKRCGYRKAWDAYQLAIQMQCQIKKVSPKLVRLWNSFGHVAENCRRYLDAEEAYKKAKFVQCLIDKDYDNPLVKEVVEKHKVIVLQQKDIGQGRS